MAWQTFREMIDTGPASLSDLARIYQVTAQSFWGAPAP